MKEYPVKSKNIKSIIYEETTRTMEVEFFKGGIYEYYDISPLIFTSISSYPSTTQWLKEKVKDKGARFRKLF